jgi:alpha-beta hydrolase superfamily lysophospholipase
MVLTMRALSLRLPATAATLPRTLVRSVVRGARAGLHALLACASLETSQRKWIFQPPPAASDDTASAGDAHDHWIEFNARDGGAPVRLHARWLEHTQADAPVLLYLHGARGDLGDSGERMQMLHALGFHVLGIDYRGFGRSSAGLPSEASACEDTLAAWCWLAQRHPQARRFVYGHSLGGALAIALASLVDDAAGLIVEGTFTSIPEVYASLSWGWLPLRRFITQRFDSARRVAQVRSPMLVVHGSADKLIAPAHGRALFERASVPKRFVLVEGGSHHDTHVLGREAYRRALREMFAVAV